MAKDFGQQLEHYAKTYKKRTRAMAKMSVQRTVELAQTPEAKGGKMPVVTGFLRNSIAANIGSMPMGPTEKGEGFSFQAETVAPVLARWDPGDEALFVGWTANYARYVEFYRGFMKGATDRWPKTVKLMAEIARHRFRA
jgi:hypothetical protein